MPRDRFADLQQYDQRVARVARYQIRTGIRLTVSVKPKMTYSPNLGIDIFIFSLSSTQYPQPELEGPLHG